MSSLAMHTIIDRVEHLQAISNLSEDQWLDLLQVTWKDYKKFLFGHPTLKTGQLQRLAKFFSLEMPDLLEKDLDFEVLSTRFNRLGKDLPEQYMVGAHGRRRTTITSLEFMEKRHGWRVKNDVLRHFNVDPSSMRDPFAPISINFIKDACELLSKRQFHPQDFYEMGRYSFEGNANSVLTKILAECPSVGDLYETFFADVITLFEENCNYSYTASKDFKSGLLTSTSNPEIAEELGVKQLGNELTCELKRGIWSILPKYIGFSDAVVTHLKCEHHGDEACVSRIDFSASQSLRD